MKKKISEYVVIVHDVRSAHNVGSIFRTADAVGVSKIYLTGYTPAPLDRFNRPVKEIAKTALGAEQSIPWEHERTFKAVAQKLKTEGYVIAAIEQSKKSIPYFSYKPPHHVALVLGNEVTGLEKAVLQKCDDVVEIPMHGNKESLNVSVAFGVVAFALKNRGAN